MSKAPRQRGIALLLVLWAFMILGVLAMDFGRTMRDDAMAAVNFAEETQAYYAAVAAFNHQLFNVAGSLRGIEQPGGSVADLAGEEDEEGDSLPADGEWHEGTFRGITYQVRGTDECSRIAINDVALRASKAGGEDERELLKRSITNILFGSNQTQGRSQRQAQDIDAIVDAIIDWVDTNHDTVNGAERDWYRTNRDYLPKNGFFDSAEELLLVRGVTADLFYGVGGRPGLRDVISVACRGEAAGNLNAKTVTAPVLEVAFGLEPQEAADLIEQRKSAGGEAFMGILQAALAPRDPSVADDLVWEPARIVYLEARAGGADGRNRSTMAALVDLSDIAEEASPLRWFDRAPWGGALPSGTVPEHGDPAS